MPTTTAKAGLAQGTGSAAAPWWPRLAQAAGTASYPWWARAAQASGLAGQPAFGPDYEVTQLQFLTAPVLTDLVPVVDVTDFLTVPASAAGSSKKMTLDQLLTIGLTVTSPGIQYVTTAGNDLNDGMTWGTAKATVQAGLNALPVTNGIQGGLVEVGYGTFPPFTISSTQSVTVNGRGTGQSYDPINQGANPQYSTIIANPGGSTTDAIQFNGAVNFGPGGQPTNTGITLSNMAITGNSSSRYGLNITCTESVVLRNLIIDNHGVFGIRQSRVYGMLLDNVYITRCGTVGAAVPTGGHFLDTALGANPGVNYFYSEAAFNYGFGVYDIGGPTSSTGFAASSSVFQNNLASAFAGSGVGFNGAGQYQFNGVDFEANALYNVSLAAGAQAMFSGCELLGDGVTTYGVYNGNGAGAVIALIGCRVAGHTSYSIYNASDNFISWAACIGLDAAGFIYNGSAAAGTVPGDGFAASVTGTTGSIITGASPQTLGSNGAVTFNASWGFNLITLNANATSSVCPVGPPGQFLDLMLVQGAGGTHTWAWFSNVKWVGASAPTISTTATWTDTFRFVSDGTSWREVYRAIGVR